MYRKPRFLEVLHRVREEMARDADYDVELFTEMVRSNKLPRHKSGRDTGDYRHRIRITATTKDAGAAPPARSTRPKRTA